MGLPKHYFEEGRWSLSRVDGRTEHRYEGLIPSLGRAGTVPNGPYDVMVGFMGLLEPASIADVQAIMASRHFMPACAAEIEAIQAQYPELRTGRAYLGLGSLRDANRIDAFFRGIVDTRGEADDAKSAMFYPFEPGKGAMKLEEKNLPLGGMRYAFITGRPSPLVNAGADCSLG
ncbi:MAG: hypothetical protein U0487_00285 [Patescibacteria group bacterium]